MTDLTYTDLEARSRAEARARMSSERRLLRNLMRAAMRTDSGTPRSQNDAVERFLSFFEDEMINPGDEVDPLVLLREFVGNEMNIAARELYRALYSEEKRGSTGAPRLHRPRAAAADDKSEPAAQAQAQGAGAMPARPSGVVGEVTRRVLKHLWLDEILINGQPLRYTTAGEARAFAASLGIRARHIELIAHGVLDTVLVGEAKTDEDAEAAYQLANTAT